MFLAKKVIASLLLPPLGPVLLALFGLVLSRAKSRRWRYAGLVLSTVSLGLLVALSLPIVSAALLAPLQTLPPATPARLSRAQAIVVLGAGIRPAAAEYGGDTVNARGLERLRHAARLARQTQLPLLVTGGAPFGGRPEADTMAETLHDDFAVAVRWRETASRDTAENAAFSAALLHAAGIQRIALVSHAWHLPRAVALFEQAGLEVIPAPTAAYRPPADALVRWLPSAAALERSTIALHEYLGLLHDSLPRKATP
ncbi:MAG: YdcF family protein [Betaproteobacteria bacterium HGW-Betaproteobacteria-11]|nr:MAG: YdcF family protein [Betaproteobacteria bacterium HGW-Betaproteobacteria-11]